MKDIKRFIKYLKIVNECWEWQGALDIDASYTDTIQRESIKSLVKDKFHSQLDWMLDRLAVEASSNNE